MTDLSFNPMEIFEQTSTMMVRACRDGYSNVYAIRAYDPETNDEKVFSDEKKNIYFIVSAQTMEFDDHFGRLKRDLHFHAQGLTFPLTTIDLGTYAVESLRKEDGTNDLILSVSRVDS